MSEMVFQTNLERKIIENEEFLNKAESLLPVLNESYITPIQLVEVLPNKKKIHGWEVRSRDSVEQLSKMDFGKGDQVILDFGEHLVGYVTINIAPVGSPPDAPLHLKLTFGEMPIEVAEDFSTYNGVISSGWLQEEVVHMDILPGILKLERRYSFRYMKVEVLATSPKYKVQFQKVVCKNVSSADLTTVSKLEHSDEMLQRMDQVSIKTLVDCMQEVFEDGPKRDRRLWLGDLRLQALANYATVKNNDLVKRCLYLFAGTPDDQGRLAANLFIQPSVIADDTYFIDYSLFFMDTLVDYFHETNDLVTLTDLWSIAFKQIENSLQFLDSNYLFKGEGFFAFIDWAEGLHKETATQGILIYVMKKAISVAHLVNKSHKLLLEETIPLLVEASKKYLWDSEKQLFVSGPTKQISYASQVWMVLAGVLSAQKAKETLEKLPSTEAIEPATPYMYHHLVEAYLVAGDRESALDRMKTYWGGMLEDGADTFWELYNPKNKSFSPYGHHLINSYCHAWSCTPTYLIRKYNM